MGNYMPADGCRSVWLMVTADKYELPVAVADTAEELARIVGVSVTTIYSIISNYVERDAKITDDYIVARQRFIVDGIRQTPTIIEADKT